MAGFNLNDLLNGKSKGAAVPEKNTQAEGPAEKQESTFDIVMIDAEDLMPSKDNFYTTEDINDLADAIELLGGIKQNLVVKPEAHGKYEVIAGHRRRLASLKLIAEGKEEYRYVPCRIETESDAIRDKLSLILTNATARQLSDWEKVQQAKELKEILTEYKKALDTEIKEAIKAGDYCRGCKFHCVDGCECEGMSEEDKATYLEAKGVNCPCYEREKMGRIREIVAEYLNTSTTQVGRMEAIDNNLSPEFKQELEKGNIGISTAHELSRLSEEDQANAYKQYEDKGELHIKDVKQEQKEEITDEQAEQAQLAITHALKGEANRAVFKAKDTAGIEKALRKHFEKSFNGSKVELEGGKHFIYRFSTEGMTLIDENWKNYLIAYTDLAEIVALMIENDMLAYDDTPEEVKNTDTAAGEATQGSGFMNEPVNAPMAAVDTEEEDNEELPGQQDMSNYPEYVPEPAEKGLDFAKYLQVKYGVAQYNMIQKVVRDTILLQAEENNNICPKEWESRITNAVSVWVMEKTKEYQAYLQG